MKIFMLLAVLLIQSCVSKSVAIAPKNHVAEAFAGFDGCFLLYNLKSGKLETEYNPEQCKLRDPPCSTFKVPLALMAFDAKILKDENTTYKWDGKKESREELNHDQTAASWISNSVVWYSRRITAKMGATQVTKYLNAFDYGNHDFSGGLQTSWLSGKGATGTLKISPLEQLEFLKKWWKKELPISQHAYDMTNKITYIETSPKGFVLNGKTGSGYKGANNELQLGWFIAHIQKGDTEYLSVVKIIQKSDFKFDAPGGAKSRQITKDILAEQGLY